VLHVNALKLHHILRSTILLFIWVTSILFGFSHLYSLARRVLTCMCKIHCIVSMKHASLWCMTVKFWCKFALLLWNLKCHKNIVMLFRWFFEREAMPWIKFSDLWRTEISSPESRTRRTELLQIQAGYKLMTVCFTKRNIWCVRRQAIFLL
jgi:hypothetical protein